jgi:hypothetical protein
MLDAGCWLLNAGYWMLVTGCWMLDAVIWIHATACLVPDAASKTEKSSLQKNGCTTPSLPPGDPGFYGF